MCVHTPFPSSLSLPPIQWCFLSNSWLLCNLIPTICVNNTHLFYCCWCCWWLSLMMITIYTTYWKIGNNKKSLFLRFMSRENHNKKKLNQTYQTLFFAGLAAKIFNLLRLDRSLDGHLAMDVNFLFLLLLSWIQYQSY